MVTGIDDDCTRLDPGLLDEFRLADGADQDVRLLHEFGEVLGLAVADGHGAVGVQKHHRHRLTEDGAAADDYGVLAGKRDVVGLEESHDAGRCCAAVGFFTHRHAAKAEAGHAIDVFAGVNRFEGGTFVDVSRYRVLQEDAVHVRVFVEFLDFVEEFLRRGVLVHHHADAFHAHAGAGVALHLDVSRACRVVAHENRRKNRGLAGLFLEGGHAGAEFFFSGLGKSLAV